MIERVPTGIEVLDQILLGGLPKGYPCAIVGSPGSGKSIFSKRFLANALQKDQPAILISTSESQEIVKETMNTFGWDSSGLIFIDCFSWRLGEPTSRYKASLINPADISVAFQKAVDEKKVSRTTAPVMVLDSFTDIARYASPLRALKVLDTLRIRLHRSGITGLITIEEGVDEPKVVYAVEYAGSGTIKMRYSEQGRFFMVSRMLATPLNLRWIPFTIGATQVARHKAN